MYDCGSQATAKMDVYFSQGEIVCLLLIRRNKRKVLKQRAVGTSLFYPWQVLFTQKRRDQVIEVKVEKEAVGNLNQTICARKKPKKTPKTTLFK